MNTISKENDSSSKIPEKIIGATDFSGQLIFLLKWQGIEGCDLIVAKKAYLMYPQFFLKWYEERLTWYDINRTLSNSTVKKCGYYESDIRLSKKHTMRSIPKKDAFNVVGEQNGVSGDVTNNVDDNGAPLEKVVEKIMGATDSSGQLMFFLKWQGIEEWDLIMAKKAYLMCPLLVLKWYEERITWN